MWRRKNMAILKTNYICGEERTWPYTFHDWCGMIFVLKSTFMTIVNTKHSVQKNAFFIGISPVDRQQRRKERSNLITSLQEGKSLYCVNYIYKYMCVCAHVHACVCVRVCACVYMQFPAVTSYTKYTYYFSKFLLWLKGLWKCYLFVKQMA